MSKPAAGEFSRPIDLERVAESEVVHDIAATAEERAALAARFGLLAIDQLEARIRLRRTRGRTELRLVGRIRADVTQACVVTLAPVEATVDEEFTVLYGTAPVTSDVDIDPEANALWEPLPAGPLDVGELVAQELVLALDPYPRASGAVLDPGLNPPVVPEPKVNPFAVLAKLRKPPQ
jgi:uncharacterized metal-binding protein YceD (DUF177 family)